jgi:hypothetical protein
MSVLYNKNYPVVYKMTYDQLLDTVGSLYMIEDGNKLHFYGIILDIMFPICSENHVILTVLTTKFQITERDAYTDYLSTHGTI